MGDPEIVRVLVDGGAQVDTVGMWGSTALHMAVQGRSSAIVTILLAGGAQTEPLNMWGSTALQLATNSGDRIIAKLLAQSTNDDAGVPAQEMSGKFDAVRPTLDDPTTPKLTAGPPVLLCKSWGDYKLQTEFHGGDVVHTRKTVGSIMSSITETWRPQRVIYAGRYTLSLQEKLPGGNQAQREDKGKRQLRAVQMIPRDSHSEPNGSWQQALVQLRGVGLQSVTKLGGLYTNGSSLTISS